VHASVRRAVIAVAVASTEAVDMTTILIGAAIGAWAGHTYYPETWPADWRLAFTGAVAVIGAVAVNGLADLIIAPVRRMLGEARRSLPRNSHRAPAAPHTLDEGLAQVAAATEDDAAERAATAAFDIDRGENFLRDETRWRGYEDGEASFHLAPGVVLHYASTEGKYRKNHHFTLLTGDGDQPVAITSMEQIRHQLAARATGLPAASAMTGDTTKDSDDSGAVSDDLTGLHAV
jgi:hypothetical protein